MGSELQKAGMKRHEEPKKFRTVLGNFVRELPRRSIIYFGFVFVAYTMGPENMGYLPAFVFFVFVFFPPREFWEALRSYHRRGESGE